MVIVCYDYFPSYSYFSQLSSRVSTGYVSLRFSRMWLSRVAWLHSFFLKRMAAPLNGIFSLLRKYMYFNSYSYFYFLVQNLRTLCHSSQKEELQLSMHQKNESVTGSCWNCPVGKPVYLQVSLIFTIRSGTL